MKRYLILYVVTVAVIVPMDFLFLGMVAKEFFRSQVGDMLGEVKLLPAILFYLLYGIGVLVFVTGSPATTVRDAAIFGALFGFFAYMTFDLTTLSILRHWTWPAAFTDVAWGTFVTAVCSTVGLVVANALAPAN